MKKIKQYRLKGIYYRSFIVLIVIPILIVFIAAIFIIRQMMVQLRRRQQKTDTYDIEKKRVLSQELDRYFNFAMCPIEDIAAATFFMKNGNYTNLKEDFSISMAEIKGADWYVQALKEKNKVSVGSFNKKITLSKYGQTPFYIAVVISPDIRVDNSGRIETVMLIVVSDLEKIIKFDMKDDLIGNTILLDEENQILLKILRTLTTFLMDYANAQEGSWQVWLPVR